MILYPGNLARSVFKVMHFATVTLLDDFLPLSRQQLSKITTD
jgi:hypothetical protein